MSGWGAPGGRISPPASRGERAAFVRPMRLLSRAPRPRRDGRLRVLATVQDPRARQAIVANRARSGAAEPPGPAPPAPAAITQPRRSALSLTLAGAVQTPGARSLPSTSPRNRMAQDRRAIAASPFASSPLTYLLFVIIRICRDKHLSSRAKPTSGVLAHIVVNSREPYA